MKSKKESKEKSEKNSEAGNKKSREDKNRLIEDKLRKLKEIRELGIEPYAYSYNRNIRAAELKERFKGLKEGESTKESFSVAGRILTIRRMGKASFCTVADSTGKIQAYLREQDIGKESYRLFKLTDSGDFIGISGEAFKTKTGELTIYVRSLTFLSKSIRPLPEKFHGLKDKELCYRKRYLDLLFNEKSRQTFILRAEIIREIRSYLDKLGFIEVETPVLQPIYGGANARPFITHHNALNTRLYMKISPELYLKRLIIGGLEKVYEIGKNFRNEGIDYNHNPEFTMLELYAAYKDYNYIMELTEELIKMLAKKVVKKEKLSYRGHEIDLTKSFRKLTLAGAILKFADIDVEKLDINQLVAIAKKNNIEIDEKKELTKGAVINLLFEELVEEKLIEPTFIMDYPVEICPLTKKHRSKKGLTERFELFIAGQEFANAYSELNDPIDQKQRLEEQERQRKVDDEAQPMDKDFVEAMEYGMPPTGGLGIGIDRLVMLLTESETIRDVILFPTLRRKKEKGN